MLLNLLLMAVQLVHGFNPLLWLGLHRLRADRELVCDAMVLRRTRPEERRAYGSLLLKLLTDFPADPADYTHRRPGGERPRELKRRIVSIKHPTAVQRGRLRDDWIRAVVLACAHLHRLRPAVACGDAGSGKSMRRQYRRLGDNAPPTRRLAMREQQPL